MIYFYSDKLTPRVQYIAAHIFTTMLKQQVKWVNAIEQLPDPATHVVVAYTAQSCPKGVFKVTPYGLLFKKGLKKQECQVGKWQGLTTFFQTLDGNIPFDIFSAVFYLITRYEEYVADEADFDEMGRFKATASLAYQQGFLMEPLVDKWVMAFEKELAACSPLYKPSANRAFVFRPLVVIDKLFKYRNNPILHNFYTLFGNIRKGKWHAVLTQLKVRLRIEEDPYNNVASLLLLHNRNNLLPVFFLRVSYDSYKEKPLYTRTVSYKNLISSHYLFELHSSPQAAHSFDKLASERKKLYKITRSQVNMNCFHKLAFRMPSSYRNLLKLSFKDDFSMVYPDMLGFRASTCTPYRYYDLEKEDYYKLQIHPIAFCDDMLRGGQYTQQDVYEKLMALAAQVAEVYGEFSCIFHNDVLSDTGRYRHWLAVYESSLRTIAKMEVK